MDIGIPLNSNKKDRERDEGQEEGSSGSLPLEEACLMRLT